MDFDWKKLVGTVAPGLATALGGPLAGLAVGAIANALGLGTPATDASGNPDTTAIQAKLAGATPADLLALRKAEQDFVVQMKQLDIDVLRIDASDRDSARKREADVKDNTPRYLAALITTGFFAVLLFLLICGAPDRGGEAFLLMLGSLSTAWAGIIAYYFGSTSGSARKTELLAASASNSAASAPK